MDVLTSFKLNPSRLKRDIGGRRRVSKKPAKKKVKGRKGT